MRKKIIGAAVVLLLSIFIFLPSSVFGETSTEVLSSPSSVNSSFFDGILKYISTKITVCVDLEKYDAMPRWSEALHRVIKSYVEKRGWQCAADIQEEESWEEKIIDEVAEGAWRKFGAIVKNRVKEWFGGLFDGVTARF